MSSSRRIQRVEKEIQQIVAQYLLTRFKDPLPVWVSVTRVQVTGDLRSAKVFLSFMGENTTDEDVVSLLQAWAPQFQKEISKQLRMKFCPKLQFLEDPTIEQALKVENLIQEVAENRGDDG